MVHAFALCKPRGKELTVSTLNVDSNAIFKKYILKKNKWFFQNKGRFRFFLNDVKKNLRCR